MIRSLWFSAISYAGSAVVYIAFSIFFLRSYGAEAYGTFSIMLNAVSALTLFGNYQGALVAYAPAVDRKAFFGMIRPVAAYAIATAVLSAMVLLSVGQIPWEYYALALLAFVCISASGLPAAAILATPHNWALNAFRAVYQSLLIIVFWMVFAGTRVMSFAFVLSLLLAAGLYLGLLAWRVRFDFPAVRTALPPRNVLVVAMVSNLALMGVMLTDKAAIRYLDVGPTAHDVGVFLLFYDVMARFTAVFVIALNPVTYELLRRMRLQNSLASVLTIAILICTAVGVIAGLAGYFVVPFIYAMDISGQSWLPAIMATYVTLYGVGSVLLAFCNAAGKVHFLVVHYVLMLVSGAAALGIFYFGFGPGLTVTQVAVSIMVGQAGAIFSGILLATSRRIPAHAQTPAPG